MTQSGDASKESAGPAVRILLLLEMPRSVPIGSRRSCHQTLDALDERHRGSVVGNRLECSGKGATCVVPMSCSIGGKSFSVMGPQLDLHRGQLLLATHDLKHRLRLGLTKQHDSIDFARLDAVGGARNGAR